MDRAQRGCSLLYGTQAILVLNLPAFGPYGEIPTKKEPIRTLGFTLRLSCLAYSNRPLICISYDISRHEHPFQAMILLALIQIQQLH